MSDKGADMGAMMCCEFEADQRPDAAAEYEGRFVRERDNQSRCIGRMCRDVISFRLNRRAARETATVSPNARTVMYLC